MSEFEQMLNESFKTIRTGETVKGTVLAVRENAVVVNIGYKHDGLIAKEDFTTEAEADLATLVNVGDEIEARVIKINDGDGNVILSTKKKHVEKFSQLIQDAKDNQTVLAATVDEVVKGGVRLTVDDIKVFMPASLTGEKFDKIESLVGQEIRFTINEYDPKKNHVIANRKDLLKAEREAAREAVLANLNEGDVVEGTVDTIKAFGAFVDLGGVDGLLHISEMSWNHVANPRKLFKEGDTVRVFVKEIKGGKIELSAKFPEENPWKDAAEIFAEGNKVKGTVARFTTFGAFVKLAEGIDGLLHISQISNERLEKPEDALTIGQEIEAVVTGLDLEAKKISLSMKKLLPPKERPVREKKNFKKEEVNYTNEDGTINIDAYAEKMAKEEAEKEAKEAAEAAKEAIEEATAEVAAEDTEATEAKTEE